MPGGSMEIYYVVESIFMTTALTLVDVAVVTFLTLFWLYVLLLIVRTFDYYMDEE